MASSPPRKRKNFNCSVCSFKAKGPTAISVHYKENPTHRRVAKQNWVSWRERKKRQDEKNKRFTEAARKNHDLEDVGGPTPDETGPVDPDNPFPQVDAPRRGRRSGANARKPINFCPGCGEDLRGFIQ